MIKNLCLWKWYKGGPGKTEGLITRYDPAEEDGLCVGRLDLDEVGAIR